MVKCNLIKFVILFIYIRSISTDCSDSILYCFNSNNMRAGEIIVPQCWMWNRLSCQPCSAG